MGHRGKQRGIVVAGSIAIAALTAGCSSSTTTATPLSSNAAAFSPAPGQFATSTQSAELLNHLVAPPGWTLTLWAVGGGKYSNPDSIEKDGSNIWVGYQNVTAKDGSDGKTSTIVEYTTSGTVVRTWTVPGHTDGLRIDPATHKAWVTSNEDGNPALNIIDPASATPQSITLSPTAHGGGYDDLAFVGGSTYIACSNPTLDANGNNVFPAVDKITVTGNSATVRPVLMGNAAATDTVANAPVTLNLTDPDSFTTDPNGNVVLVSQGDSALITISNPGAANQAVTKTPIGNQEDDTVWTTANSGTLFVTDAGKNAVYTIKWSGPKGTVFTEAPNDSGVVGFIGTIDLKTGFITPVSTGWVKPTGLLFVPAS
ncbi:MAG: hypothetical protein JF886_02955 [Candidatus Dormibacteraeota bacterium]|uniref:SMP-30/Gluconolactonase/LRE-like region domain-containing protein n=1 Tax=Candidatus Aeolococcus gillhamiae TaxID=3127015 RepID=A0A2W5Z987_9BACT|nr:hypothetical protein [Candidatus Dormibacteraeota bacterium]PZR81900.1 MAG: hypothetical protein DLM65_04975 [Candidatus Dormibacter sp. RRmetagenome_bin12]